LLPLVLAACGAEPGFAPPTVRSHM
jgi:hypothetical protein